MRSSKETYRRVAFECSEYARDHSYPGNYYNLKNHCCDEKPSCLTCKHFKDEHCVLDLYDPIVKRIGES